MYCKLVLLLPVRYVSLTCLFLFLDRRRTAVCVLCLADAISTTDDIIGCYIILEALRVLLKWFEETFAPRFSNGVKPE
jgi:hypothetical protein